MNDQDRTAVITHHIGRQGQFTLRTVRGSVRVRATDGEEARVEARYSSRSGGGGDPESEGAISVKRGESELIIELNDPSTGIGSVLGALGRMTGIGRPSVDFDVSLPAGTDLRLSGVSADLDIRGMSGDQEIRTVSGDLSLDEVSGRIVLHSVTGDVLLRGDVVSLDGTTTSGDLSAVANEFGDVRLRSVSGDMRLAGGFSRGPTHSIESVSGDLELSPLNGMTIRMSTLSGAIKSELSHRLESRGGRRTATVGDGAADVSVRTMSGDVTILRSVGQPAEPDSFTRFRDASAPPDSATGPWDWKVPDMSRWGSKPPKAPKVPKVPARPDAPSPPAPPMDELAILQALERGELDVDSAARLLEGVRSDDR